MNKFNKPHCWWHQITGSTCIHRLIEYPPTLLRMIISSKHQQRTLVRRRATRYEYRDWIGKDRTRQNFPLACGALKKHKLTRDLKSLTLNWHSYGSMAIDTSFITFFSHNLTRYWYSRKLLTIYLVRLKCTLRIFLNIVMVI